MQFSLVFFGIQKKKKRRMDFQAANLEQSRFNVDIGYKMEKQNKAIFVLIFYLFDYVFLVFYYAFFTYATSFLNNFGMLFLIENLSKNNSSTSQNRLYKISLQILLIKLYSIYYCCVLCLGFRFFLSLFTYIFLFS